MRERVQQLRQGRLAQEAEVVADVGVEELALTEAALHGRVRLSRDVLIRITTSGLKHDEQLPAVGVVLERANNSTKA
jgi:hypothetical protein